PPLADPAAPRMAIPQSPSPRMLMLVLINLTALILTTGFALLRRRNLERRFWRERTPMPEDPFEIAFLAGGLPRVSQVAVIRALIRGNLTWKQGIFGVKLVPVPADVGSISAIDRHLHAVVARRAAGLALGNVVQD